MKLPQYPVYIPSKGRVDIGRFTTAQYLNEDNVPFYVVVEKEEYEQYKERWGPDRVLVLPFSNRGSVIPARNWIKQHATESGFKRHWQLDDNMAGFFRYQNGLRIRCTSSYALRVAEDFTERYENIAITGIEYGMFATNVAKPFRLNTRVYSCSLILNDMPFGWRGRYNEDTDLCLQVLSAGYCTVLIIAVNVDKCCTLKQKGGNTDTVYQGNGRLTMSRSLERLWPGIVTTDRRFGRPQHKVDWSKFDTQLIRRKDIDWDNMHLEAKKYETKLVAVDEVKSEQLRRLVYGETNKADQ